MQDVDWNDLRFILAVGRTGSFAQAARQLSVNETTVSRRISRIEEQLSASLLDRSRHGFSLTEEGKLLFATAESMESQIKSVQDTLANADQRIEGTVRLTSVPFLINRVLVPALPELLAAHPQLKIELIAEPRDLSLTHRECDIALRMARPNSEMQVITRKIASLEYAVYAGSHSDGQSLTWVGYEGGMADLPQNRAIADHCQGKDASYASVFPNDAEAVYECVLAGLGKSLLPTLVADRDKRLRRLKGRLPCLSREIWLMVHPQARQLARVKAVINWLEGLFCC